ncbi:hypothetical protein KCU95_g79, partial [Aureobasidium melanogenum]
MASRAQHQVVMWSSQPHCVTQRDDEDLRACRSPLCDLSVEVWCLGVLEQARIMIDETLRTLFLPVNAKNTPLRPLCWALKHSSSTLFTFLSSSRRRHRSFLSATASLCLIKPGYLDFDSASSRSIFSILNKIPEVLHECAMIVQSLIALSFPPRIDFASPLMTLFSSCRTDWVVLCLLPVNSTAGSVTISFQPHTQPISRLLLLLISVSLSVLISF